MKILAAPTSAMYNAICPVAPPGAQAYVDQISGNVVWVMIVLFGVVPFLSLISILCGRIFHMPRFSQAGVIGLVLVFVLAIVALVVPGMLSGMLGDGCV